jgi:hypothetical protein
MHIFFPLGESWKLLLRFWSLFEFKKVRLGSPVKSLISLGSSSGGIRRLVVQQRGGGGGENSGTVSVMIEGCTSITLRAVKSVSIG